MCTCRARGVKGESPQTTRRHMKAHETTISPRILAHTLFSASALRAASLSSYFLHACVTGTSVAAACMLRTVAAAALLGQQQCSQGCSWGQQWAHAGPLGLHVLENRHRLPRPPPRQVRPMQKAHACMHSAHGCSLATLLGLLLEFLQPFCLRERSPARNGCHAASAMRIPALVLSYYTSVWGCARCSGEPMWFRGPASQSWTSFIVCGVCLA
jgi:hypothetical protein